MANPAGGAHHSAAGSLRQSPAAVGLAAFPAGPFSPSPVAPRSSARPCGLAALDELRLHNVAATLFEARGATGGRTRSVQGVFAPEFAFDEGAQLVNTDHADLLGMIRRYRIRMVDRQAFGLAHEVQIGRNGAVAAEASCECAPRISARITADSGPARRD